jgi:hypothetical protein
MLRRHKRERAHTLGNTGRQNKDVGPQDVVITPSRKRCCASLWMPRDGPPPWGSPQMPFFVKGKTGLQ